MHSALRNIVLERYSFFSNCFFLHARSLNPSASIHDKQGDERTDITPEKSVSGQKISRKQSNKPHCFVRKNTYQKEKTGEWHLKQNSGFKALLRQIEGHSPQSAVVHSVDLRHEQQGIEQLTTLMSVPDIDIEQVESIVLDGIDIADLDTLPSEGSSPNSH